MVEIVSKSLQRYYDNREEINEKQKLYFRTVYYQKNRLKLLDNFRIYRTNNLLGMPKKNKGVIIQKNVNLVSF